jgi:hypothetical protein
VILPMQKTCNDSSYMNLVTVSKGPEVFTQFSDDRGQEFIRFDPSKRRKGMWSKSLAPHENEGSVVSKAMICCDASE